MGVEEELLVVDAAGGLVDPRSGRPAPAADVVRTLVAPVRPALPDSGDVDRVEDGVAELLRRGNGATMQRAVYAQSGDLAAVVRAAVSTTHAR